VRLLDNEDCISEHLFWTVDTADCYHSAVTNQPRVLFLNSDRNQKRQSAALVLTALSSQCYQLFCY
jgi:hypothetical protein